MSLISQLRKHAAHAVITWRQRAAASVLGPVLYETTCAYERKPPREWLALERWEQEKWCPRALSVLKVSAEQERQSAQAAHERETMDALIRECYPHVSAEASSRKDAGTAANEYPLTQPPPNVTPIRTRRGVEDFEPLDPRDF